MRALPRFFIHYLTELNLFPSIPPSTNEDDLRPQRISTRIFVVSLCLSLTILLIYTSAINVTKTVTVEAPDFNRYKQLYEQYQQALVCPCKQISINYNTFLNINYTLHQVCSSYYVTDEWILFFFNSNPGSIFLTDFRSTGRQIFLALKALCTLVGQTISTNLVQFYATNYVSAVAISTDTFKSQSEAFIQQFISSTTSNFALSLRRIRDITQANSLASALSNNVRFAGTSRSEELLMRWVTYDNDCICASNSECTGASNIYKNSSHSLWWPVPGFYAGCFSLQTLRQCSLECFYNATCATELKLQMESTSPISTSLLNSSAPSRFLPNTNVGTMIDLLMVDQWESSIMYENYYTACQPSQCAYTISKKNDAIYIVATLIGLIGGLITALKLVVPNSVRFLYKCMQHKERTRSTIRPMRNRWN